MLKIVDDVDLKELEKHLIKLNIKDNNEKFIQKNAYCCISEDDKEFIRNKSIENYFVQFFINNKNEIDYFYNPTKKDEKFINEKIFDLTKTGLIEKYRWREVKKWEI